MGVLQVVVLLLYRLNYRSFLVGFRDCYICHPCHICHIWIVAEDPRYPRYGAVLVESFKAEDPLHPRHSIVLIVAEDSRYSRYSDVLVESRRPTAPQVQHRLDSKPKTHCTLGTAPS